MARDFGRQGRDEAFANSMLQFCLKFTKADELTEHTAQTKIIKLN